jgi:hypothetical protein
MEPLDDRELGELLRTWDAPGAPSGLHPPRDRRSRLWAWLLHGSIRIPVPAAAIALVVCATFLIWWSWTGRGSPPGTVSFAEFQPVKQLQPRVIRSSYDCQ